MGESLTYHDALKILGASESKIVTLLDAAATAGLTVWAATAWATGKDAGPPSSMLDVKNEIVPFAHQIIRKIAEWRSGLSRFDRSQRLTAAHAVLVVSSYFEALGKADLPVPIGELGFTREEQSALASGGAVPESYVAMIQLLLREPLPLPETHRSYGEVRRSIGNFYAKLSVRVITFLSGLSVWDRLDQGQRSRLQDVILQLPARALEHYDGAYRNLAVDNREFMVWACLTEMHALGAGLNELGTLLNEMAVRLPGDRPLSHLLRSYRAALEEPIVGSAEAPDGVVLPTLGEAYLNPECRIAEVGPGDNPAASEWWERQEIIADIETFFAGYFASPRATRSPLVVLGEPGCGKSKLTEVLAARLAEQDFLPVRVELRDVAAESIILEQIEQAIYRGPGERASWPDLVEASTDAQPVVLLDGFDELVQAAAINRYDYLEQVREFQRQQARIGHPVIVIVTSRTVVADHARFPAGTLALQIQPFTEEQVRRWLEIWAQCNSPVLAARGLKSLPAETAMAHRDLATQPLLLTLLAIFDAAGNALQNNETPLSRAELYENLFTEFAMREVRKSARNRSLPAERLQDLSEQELQRLAIVALAMFARSRQFATDAELNHDIPILFHEDSDLLTDTSAITAAQRATGRFFFIHKSEARARNERMRTYEFLHSTFGEFLVARLALNALRDLATVRDALRRGVTAGVKQLDDGFLFAILSFSCVAARAPIVDFLRELLASINTGERARCQEMLSTLLVDSLYPHPNRSFVEYEPIRYPVPRRLAVYSSNIMIILVLLSKEISASRIFGDTGAGSRWREFGYLWRGMLITTEWSGVVSTIRARINAADEPIDIHLSVEDGSPVSPIDSIAVRTDRSWPDANDFDVLAAADERVSFDVAIPAHSYAGRAFRDLAYFPNWHTSLLLLQTVPFIRATGGEVRRVYNDGPGFLPGYLLAQLDYTRDADLNERWQLYQHCMNFMSTFPELCEQLLRRLRGDAWKFAPADIVDLLRSASSVPPTDTYISLINELWWRVQSEPEKMVVIDMIGKVRDSWPQIERMGIDRHLRAAIKERFYGV